MTALVIGCGNIGAMYDIDSDEILTHVSGYRNAGIPVSIFDTNEQNTEKVLNRYNDVNAIERVDEDSISSFTFVSICVPTPHHLEYFRTCISAEVSVIILEKPISLDHRELDEALELYRQSNSKVLVNYIRRFQPGFIELKKLIKETSTPDDLESVYIEYYKGLLNTGSHLFDIVQFLTGQTLTYDDLSITSSAFDHFDDDPTCSFQFISSHVKYAVSGLEHQQTSSFKMRMKFKDWELTLDEGCAVAKILNGPKHHLRADNPELFDQYLLKDYMKAVIHEAIALVEDSSLPDNFTSAVELNQQLLKITKPDQMKLAINGGPALRTDLFPIYNTIGEEKQAVMQVLETGNLSQFLGGFHDDFYGGPNVREFEKLWAGEIGTEFGISVNSNTSGLYTAIGAAGVGPGDEVIVSPYTMTASAIAPMIYGAVPVFADVDKENFCLEPESVRSRITSRTKAILVVHIFGNPAKMDELVQIAKEHDLILIEDCAQAPFAEYKGKRVGTIGDMGIFSFNYHKHIHTGEGGIITTNDPKLAQRCQLIRNHGENVAGPMGVTEIHGLYGFNYRMPEMEAAIAICQTKKLPKLIEQRLENVNYLNKAFKQMDCFDIPKAEANCKHVYYVHPLLYKKEALGGLDRNKFVDAVKAEVPSSYLRETTPLIGAGYMRPLYLQPIYQQRAATCAFNCSHYDGNVSYEEGICPNTEWLYKEAIITHEFMRPGMSSSDLDDVIAGFQKVIEHHTELL